MFVMDSMNWREVTPLSGVFVPYRWHPHFLLTLPSLVSEVGRAPGASWLVGSGLSSVNQSINQGLPM